jgi:hypothetical protein
MSEFAAPAREAAEAIGHWFSAVYDDLAALAKASDRAIRDNRGRRENLTEKDLRAIRPAAIGFLDRHRIPEAAGIALPTGSVDADRGSVEWWRRTGDHDAERVVFNLNPSSTGFYDFESLDWFTDVVAAGKPTVHGPYLDYAGMDQYILTLMVPFALDGEPLGTAGCDIEVRSLETTMIPILRHIPADAALVSKRDRIIVGNSGRFLVGNRVGDLPTGGIRLEIPGPDLGLSLVAVESLLG